ncbi:MAG: LuxR C-terminal-related transcriptional regulator, partial [Oscillospiraceae bacterium]
IIKAIGTGKTKHEIAQELYISERTLSNHIQSIYDKLGAKNAIEAYLTQGYCTWIYHTLNMSLGNKRDRYIRTQVTSMHIM